MTILSRGNLSLVRRAKENEWSSGVSFVWLIEDVHEVSIFMRSSMTIYAWMWWSSVMSSDGVKRGIDSFRFFTTVRESDKPLKADNCTAFSKLSHSESLALSFVRWEVLVMVNNTVCAAVNQNFEWRSSSIINHIIHPRINMFSDERNHIRMSQQVWKTCWDISQN